MMNKYIKTDVEGFVKDPVSGAVLNVDTEKLSAYKKQKQFYENNKKNSERIEKLENDIGDIKEMLQQLLKR
jgi:5'-3' exonuclease